VRGATAQASYSQTSSGQINPVNQLLDITGTTGVLAALRDFSAAFANAAVSPNDATLRNAGLDAARNVALAFNRTAASLDSIQNQIDTSIQATVRQVNALSSTIAGYNARLRGRTDFDPQLDANLRTAIDSLASLVDISTSKNQDGTVTVLAGATLPLVSEDQTWALGVNPGAPAGSQVTSAGGGAPPSKLLGSLGGLLNVRNNGVTALIGANGQAGSLNTLASGFAARVNSLLASGVTSTGTSGTALFSFDNIDASNVARTLAVISTVTPSDLALAATGTGSQSNGIANQLAGLSTSTAVADQISGLSAEGLFASIAAGIGQRTADTASASQLDRTAQTTAENDRQQISGVSLDTEAVLLTAGQRAYEAAAKLFSTLNQLTETEVNLIK
jgi:flagellar hook-associated protein 1 FlgK